MGTELGGGVLAGSLQQMWPVQGWRGAAGGAAPGGRALGRGRPGRTRAHAQNRGSATSRRPPRFPPPQGARTGHSSLSFCCPPGWAQPAPAPSQPVASQKAPVFAETRALGTDAPPPPPDQVMVVALRPVRGCSTRSAPLVPGQCRHRSLPALRAGPLTALRGALETRVGAELPGDTRKPRGHWQSTSEAANGWGPSIRVLDTGRGPRSLAERWFP